MTGTTGARGQAAAVRTEEETVTGVEHARTPASTSSPAGAGPDPTAAKQPPTGTPETSTLSLPVQVAQNDESEVSQESAGYSPHAPDVLHEATLEQLRKLGSDSFPSVQEVVDLYNALPDTRKRRDPLHSLAWRIGFRWQSGSWPALPGSGRKGRSEPQAPHGVGTSASGLIAELRAAASHGRVSLNEWQQANYQTVEPALSPFVTRPGCSFIPSGDHVRAALVLPRGKDGTLSPTALSIIMEGFAAIAHEAHTVISQMNTMVHPDISPEQMRAMITPEIAGVFPEIASFLNRADQSSSVDVNTPLQGMIRRTFQNGNATITLLLDPSEPIKLRESRVRQLTIAVNLVEKAGFKLPDMEFYFPKYGRRVQALPGEGFATNPLEPTWAGVAQFLAPKQIAVSPESVGALERVRLDGGRFHAVGMQFREQGVGVLIHELGHLLHYANNRSRYIDAASSHFTPSAAATARILSEYAGSGPTEFVAEYFLGLVMGKTFTPEQDRMYDALGGARPPYPAAQTALQLQSDQLRHLTLEVNSQLVRRGDLRTRPADLIRTTYERLPRDLKSSYTELIAEAIADILKSESAGQMGVS
ncbi:hypothetical protein [Streptomyces sp. NPDC007856]|uniref:hypothetical protein n=1 Tax=Streptomyces sp. NPDC007856 TaxID=3364781 RepID=UPI003681A43E